jgi:L-rhamnose 1-dehydrogenase
MQGFASFRNFCRKLFFPLFLSLFTSQTWKLQFYSFVLTVACLRLEKDLFDFTISTNLSGAFYATQAAARQMVTQGHGGSIIGVSSISALVGGALQTHYTPTKAGVLSLMQSCACALGKYNIRCNALLPGTIRTQLNEKDLENDEKRKYMEGRIPLGRTGIPHDLAGPAVFLASDMSEYVVSNLYNLTCDRANPNASTDRGTAISRWRPLCQSTMNNNIKRFAIA